MTALVTIDEYKVYKKLTKTENDNELLAIINSASAMIKSYCGHSFVDYYSTNRVETFNIQPGIDDVTLNEWPIKEIVSVESRDSYSDSYSAVDTSEYFVDTSIDTIFKHSGYWPEGFGSVKVTYKGGYTTAPEDVKIACMDLVSHYFKEEYKERRSIGAASIDNSTRFNSSKFSNSKWPTHVVRILDMYRNV